MIYIALLIFMQQPLEKVLYQASSTQQVLEVIKTFKLSTRREIFDFIPSINPLNPSKIKRFSSSFGARFHPIDKRYKVHLGLDISCPEYTPVHVAAKGTVIDVAKSASYGNYVIVLHKYGFKTKYAHLSQILCQPGMLLSKGAIIGRVGNTGKSTASHLHYEVIKNSSPIDPYPLIQF